MPAATCVVQDAGKPLRPSTSTRHRRQEPKAFSESVAHSLGIRASASAAARMMDVPAGTVTLAPSISSVIASADVAGGVPRSRWSIEYT
jgi:fructose-1,6-bisphosphatase/inositol monophosphatase family enzyme